MDSLVERLSRRVAQRTSRRGFLGYLGKALVGGMMIPLLPINRVVEQAGRRRTMRPVTEPRARGAI